MKKQLSIQSLIERAKAVGGSLTWKDDERDDTFILKIGKYEFTDETLKEVDRLLTIAEKLKSRKK